MSNTTIASTTTSTNAVIDNETALHDNTRVIILLRKLEYLAGEMMNILEASIARTKSNPELVKEDAERYACLFKETAAAFTSLPEEYRIKAHLKTDKWMGANLDAKDSEMLSSYIKVGRTLFSDILMEVKNN